MKKQNGSHGRLHQRSTIQLRWRRQQHCSICHIFEPPAHTSISVGSAVNLHDHRAPSYWSHMLMRALWRFSLAFTPAIHEKTGEENFKSGVHLFFQTVNTGAELLLRYTLLGLERTSWSRSHIFHSLASLANLSRLGTSGPQKSYDELASAEIASRSGPIGAFGLITPNQTSSHCLFLKFLLFPIPSLKQKQQKILDANKTKRIAGGTSPIPFTVSSIGAEEVYAGAGEGAFSFDKSSPFSARI